MILVWTRLGFLIPIIFIAIAIIIFSISSSIFTQEYIESARWLFSLMFLISGIIYWFLGNLLNNKKSKKMIDPQTNRVVFIKKRHNFFFIPIQYWLFIMIIIGIILFFTPQ